MLVDLCVSNNQPLLQTKLMQRNSYALLLFVLVFLLSSLAAQATTDKYRLVWRNNPATTACIGWNQVSGSNPVVYYGTTDQGTNWSAYPNSQAVSRSVSYAGMNNRFARLSGLQPNTAYYFVIRDSEGTSARMWFKTAPDTNTERLSILAGGDSRNNRTPRQNANRLVAKLRPHVVMFGGDFTDNGSNTQWSNWFDDWQLTIGSDGRIIPLIPARGNHESSNGMVQNLFDVESSNIYYAYNIGGDLLRVYTLNTEISISGNQTTWLSSDLQANAGSVTWKFAQYHKPMRPHVSGKSEGNNQYNNWASLFYQHGVKLVVECDAHTVKTTWPVVPSTGSGSDEGFIRDDANGTVYVGEGCWGAPLRSNDDNKNWTRNSGSFNQIKWVFVGQDRVEVRTLRTDNASQVGQVSDSDIFTAPSNLDIWSPGNGPVVTINNANVSAPEVSLTSPVAGASYASGGSMNLSATASDADGSVQKVDFLINGSIVATDQSSPYSATYTFPTDGSYEVKARATDNDGNTSESATVTVISGTVAQSIDIRINSGGDDVEENANGSMYTNSSDIELVADGSRGNQTIGLLFRSLGIPQGATITNAYIQFTVDETSTESTSLSIRAQDTDNAAVFGTGSYNVSNRSKTSAAVSWNPSSWSSVGAAGSTQRTPEIKNVVQEVVSRQGWSTGSNLAIIITGSGRRTAEAYEGSSAGAALLHVEYIAGGTAPPANQSPTVAITNPANNSSYSSLTTLTIAANAGDVDGSVAKVDFFVDGALVGTDASAPYSTSWTIPAYGDYVLTARATDNEGAGTTSSAIAISAAQAGPVTGSATVSIISDNDDVEERQNGYMYFNSSDLELVYDTYQSAGNQTVGLRFRGLDIPQGATITNAYLQFTADETNSAACNLTIRAEDVNNSAAFTSAYYNLSGRNRTSASVNWSPAAWTSVNQRSNAQRSPDLSAVVQEVTSRSGWSAGNNFTIIITGTGKRTADSYKGGSTKAATLHVEYSVSAARAGILEITNLQPKMETYPNPAADILHVRLQGVQGAGLFRLLNMAGKECWSAYYPDLTTTELSLDFEDVEHGVYILQLETSQGEVIRQKILKQ